MVSSDAPDPPAKPATAGPRRKKAAAPRRRKDTPQPVAAIGERSIQDSTPQRAARRIFVHIGMPRSASTTIQTLLDTNRALLLERGICFPHCLGPSVPNQIFRLISGDEALQAALVAETHTATDIVVSEEKLFTLLTGVSDIARLQHCLAKLGGHVKIICYLRRQDEILVSGYGLDVTAGKTSPLELSPKFARARLFDFHDVLSEWSDVFGAENLVVRRFGKPYLLQGDMIADFAQVIGLDLEGLVIPPSQNESLDIRAVEALRVLNAHAGAASVERIIALQAGLVNLPRRVRPGAPRAARLELLAGYEEGNQRVAKDFLGLDGPLFTHDIPDDGYDLTVDDFAAVMLHWVQHMALADPNAEKPKFSKILYRRIKDAIAYGNYQFAEELLVLLLDKYAHEDVHPRFDLVLKLAGSRKKLGRVAAALETLDGARDDASVTPSLAAKAATLALSCGDAGLAQHFRALATQT